MVADGRPLERTLLRYILEDNGVEVPAEAGTVVDTVLFVERERPDVVVVHEDLAREGDVSLLERLGEIPGTHVVLVTRSGTAGADLPGHVDAVIEEGIGLQDLSAAVWRASGRSRSTGDRAIRAFQSFARREREQARVRPIRAKGRWLERSKGAIAASIVILGLLFARSTLPSPSGQPAGAPLAAAQDSLEALVAQLPGASPEQAARAARILIVQRAVAVAAGLDVSALDRQIRASLLPLLPELPPATAAALIAVLGDLIGTETLPSPEPSTAPPTTEPAPSPSEPPPPEPTTTPEPSTTDTPPPEPSPTESPSPEPSETPSPEPSETPSPEPSETPSPAPSETPSPAPSETPSPTPSETPSPAPSGSPPPTESPSPTAEPSSGPPAGPPADPPPIDPPGPPVDPPGPPPHAASSEGTTQAVGLVLVPPGILLLTLTSWFARRRTRRR